MLTIAGASSWYSALTTGKPSAKSLDCVQKMALEADAATSRRRDRASPARLDSSNVEQTNTVKKRVALPHATAACAR